MQAAVSSELIAAALAACGRVNDFDEDGSDDAVPLDDVTSLVIACTAALFDPEVSDAFATTIHGICYRSANKATCGAAGVIPVVVSAMRMHGAVNARVAAKGCGALANLAHGHSGNANAIATSAGGLDGILSVMTSHAGDEEVQKWASHALNILVGNVTPAALAVIRESRAVELLNAAKSNFPATNGYDTVTNHAALALGRLQ